jgi:hypothetical protein
MPAEQRIFTRIPFSNPVRWRADQDWAGVASVRNVSRTGVGLTLQSFLRPGPVVHLAFEGIEYDGAPIEVAAHTVWCRPETPASDRFVAGFAIVHDDPNTLAPMSEVFYAAIRQYEQNRRAR